MSSLRNRVDALTAETRDAEIILLTILGLTAGGSLTFYIYSTYMQKFLTNSAGFTRDQATELSAATLFFFMLAQPLVATLLFSILASCL